MTVGEERAGIPAGLMQRTANALTQLRNRSDGRLPLPLRRYVRDGFGPWTTDGAGSFSPGWRRRAHLARLVAERVMPLWVANEPHDRLPQLMLQIAEDVLAGRLPPEEARQRGNLAFARLTGDPDLDPRAMSAGIAAVEAAHTAADGDYNPDDVAPDDDDDDLDPYGWEGAYFAALAEAPPVSPTDPGDIEARRRYWEWYLKQAVPVAYAVVLG